MSTHSKKEEANLIQARYGAYIEQYQEADGPLSIVVDGCAPQDAAAQGNEANSLAEMLYSAADLADLPASVTDVSLGCGDPLATAHLQPGEVVLDLGSGGGIDCFMAAKAVGPTGQVIGVDITDNMIAQANKNKTKLGLTNVEFRQGQIEALPVESSSVDVIMSNCVIDISPDKATVFVEAFRVLRPGGRLTISDVVTVGKFPAPIKANVDRWAGAVITPLISQTEFLNFIRQAGFVEVTIESRVSYGLENLEALDEESRQILTKDVDWSTLPAEARLYSIRVVAKKPAGR